MGVEIVPANEASWEDLQLIFGERGYPHRCLCQRYKLGQAGYAPQPWEARAEALREDTQCGVPDAAETSGLVAFVDGEPAGWVAVEPRVNYRIFQINLPSATVWAGHVAVLHLDRRYHEHCGSDWSNPHRGAARKVLRGASRKTLGSTARRVPARPLGFPVV